MTPKRIQLIILLTIILSVLLQLFSFNGVHWLSTFFVVEEERATTTTTRTSKWIAATTTTCESSSASSSASLWFPSDDDPTASNRIFNVSEVLHSNIDESILDDIGCNDSVITQRVQIVPTCPYWQLITHNALGRPKSVGGDEFYITYTDNAAPKRNRPTATANVIDLKNGTYRLEFVSSPINDHLHRLTGQGTISVYFQYTCSIGTLPPPHKNNSTIWKDGGSTNFMYSASNVSIPPIKPFQPPSRDDDDDDNNDIVVDLSQYEMIVPVGDSLMGHFVEPLGIKCPNLGMPLNRDTINRWMERIRSERYFTSRFKHAKTASLRTAIIVRSHAWDLLSNDPVATDQIGHAEALITLLTFLRTTYPFADVIMKSPLALHIHVPMLQSKTKIAALGRAMGGPGNPFQKLIDRVRYLSEARSRQWHMVQKNVSETLGVPYLDLYEASFLAADHLLHGDGRHYNPAINTMMVNWFLGTSPAEKMWEILKSRQQQNQLKERRGVVIPASQDSFIGIANAILVSLVSNKEIQWTYRTAEEESGHSTIPSIISKRLREIGFISDQTLSAIIEDDDNDTIVTLDEKTTQAVMPMDEIERYTSDPKGPYRQEVEKLFWDGKSFLYGMIFTDLLKPVITVDTAIKEQFRRNNRLESYNSVVVAIHEFEDRPDLRPCLSKLLPGAEYRSDRGLACHVLFATDANAREWATVLQDEYSCQALTIPSSSSTSSPSLLSSDSSGDGLPTFLSNLDIIASTAYDGYIIPQNIESYAFRYMIHYQRSLNARKKGILPISELPWCPWQ